MYDKGARKRTGNILTKLVREECANLVNGKCLGLTVYSVPFRAPGECRIIQGKPCGYFRDIILKIARQRGVFEKAVKKYAVLDPRVSGDDAAVRRCDCGAELLPRRRLCDACALRKKRKASRESWHRRKGRKAMSPTRQLTKNGLPNMLSCKEL